MLFRMSRTGEKKRSGRGWLLAAVFALLWFTGAVGVGLRPLLLRLLPLARSGFTIASHGNADVPDPPMGAALSVSEPRLRRLAHDLLGWKAHLIPPKLIPPTYAVSGTAKVKFDEDAKPIDLPFVLRIVPALPAPTLSVRLPSDLVNQALDYEGSFASREKTHRYMLGHYETIHWIRFDTVSLASELTEKEMRRPVTFRRIAGQATGQVRFKVKENVGNASTTARVRRMELRCDLDFKQYLDGLSLTYKLTIPKLDADINNLAPMFEGRPTEALRKRLEESMARTKKLERMARKRYPRGIPLDLALKVEVYKSESASKN